jgi:hypothetical protein
MQGDAPAGAPKGIKTNEVCDRPLETFGALPCLLIGIGGFLFLGYISPSEPKVLWINTRKKYDSVTN